MAENTLPASVLIVDDEPRMVALLEDSLNRKGFVCATAASGERAWTLLEQKAFDAVVAGLNLPDLPGLELLRRTRLRYPWIAFVFMTGMPDLQLAITAMKDGADDYLLKPLPMETVAECVRHSLTQRRSRAEREQYHQNLEELVAERTRQLRLALQQIETTYDQTLQTLGMALDLRAHEVAGHSLRVSRYSVEIATCMGYSRESLVRLARAAYLHDIGKLGIPDAILLKPGPLTPEEQIIMQSHVRIGYELVNRIALLKSAGGLICAHQERWDGSGYPNGLSGKDIPLDARIFAVADTLDAMTSDRPYRSALPLPMAVDEIRAHAGRQFDPRVVQAFLEVPRERWGQIREELSERYGNSALFVLADNLVGTAATALGVIVPEHPGKNDLDRR